eukprot:9483436-Pyramimonas_sp.AAC.1
MTCFIIRRFWFTHTDLRFRALVFRCAVWSALLSGLTAFALRSHDYTVFDKCITFRARKLLKGKATLKTPPIDGTIKYQPVPTIEIWRSIGLADTLTELRIQRLKWFQQICRHPLHHQLYVTAMFGRLPHDDGALVSHPWTVQIRTDVQALSRLESAHFLEGVCPVDLLTLGNLQEDFLIVDVSELRAQYLSASIPPPSYEYDCDVLHPSPSSCALPSGEYYCGLTRPDGNLCTCTFNTLKALRLHRAREQSLHGMITLGSIVQEAIGPWCPTHFATRKMHNV